ncbi:MAG: glutamylcysteine synthetase [Ruminococcus sp.]|nr:glutamylcysteine synthetase [Ruminococcus sp.]
MDKINLNEMVYEKYIAPTKKKRERCIGVEIELPIVNLSGEAVDEWIPIFIAGQFRTKFGFEITGTDVLGNVNSMSDTLTGDNLSFDCCYSNLELSFGKCNDIFEIQKRFSTYYTFLNECFSEYNYTLTGMGVNPGYNVNHNEPIQNERYRMLYHHLYSYPKYEQQSELKFSNRADFGTFTSASQVQLDVYYDSLLKTINTFELVEPYKALLFGNSYIAEKPDMLNVRNWLWEHSMQGYNPHNVGMFGHKLKSISELIEYIKSTSIYCTMRNGKYVNFTPIPIGEYYKMDFVAGEYFDGDRYQSIQITPKAEDLAHLRSFKFEDLTYRGTIELRSTCCQPVHDSMAVAAFNIGLIEKIDELNELLEQDTIIYSHGYNARELQKMLSCSKLPTYIDQDLLKKQLKNIIDLAADGLKSRGKSEEIFLDPLYERSECLTNPARRMVEGLKAGKSMRDFILDYAKL